MTLWNVELRKRNLGAQRNLDFETSFDDHDDFEFRFQKSRTFQGEKLGKAIDNEKRETTLH